MHLYVQFFCIPASGVWVGVGGGGGRDSAPVIASRCDDIKEQFRETEL